MYRRQVDIIPRKLLIIGPDPFISQSSPDHSPELTFHIMKSRDQTSVHLCATERANQRAAQNNYYV